MRERGHVINAVLLSVGIGVMLEPDISWRTAEVVAGVGVPVLLGALFPDVDTSFGKHRATLHNVPVLAIFVVFPVVFGNLAYVWLGVLTHYVLDLLGNVRGMALWYPYPKFYDVPIGVNIDSPLADVVTMLVTGIELLVAAALIQAGREGVLASPSGLLDGLHLAI